MWNVLYESAFVKWYTYPFAYGVAASLFLWLSVQMSRITGVGWLRCTKKHSSNELVGVLDASMLFMVALWLISRLGGWVYSGGGTPLLAEGGGQVTSDFGVFGLAVFAAGTAEKWPNLRRLWSLWAGPMLLGGAIGAIGCFAFGCCYGRPVQENAAWAVKYPVRHNEAGDVIGAPALVTQMQDGKLPYSATESLPVFPVQLYCSGLLLIGGITCCLGVGLVPSHNWFLFAAFYYMCVRIGTDLLRGDYAVNAGSGGQGQRLRIFMLVTLVALLSIGVLSSL